MRCSNDRDLEGRPPLDGLRLLTMEERHVPEIAAIEAAAFPAPWRPQHFLHEIRHGRFGMNLVAERNARVAAYVCAWVLFDELKINNLAVREDLRGCGVGRWLLRCALARARLRDCARATLEVRPSNLAALHLYREHGFVEIGRREGYYDNGAEDAIVMEMPF